MKKKKIYTALTAAVLCIAALADIGASAAEYFPDVTKEMSDAEFWSNDDELLLNIEEIENLNKQTVSEKGTNMYDLKNHAEAVDGIALNEGLISSAKKDVEYYLGWTYINGDEPATEADFEKMISNTQNQNPQKEQKVKYAVAVKRSALLAFPSPDAILDDPKDSDFDYRFLSGVRVNEPLVITSISADEKYYLAKSICCSGWISVEDVAVCADKEEWLGAWDISPEKAVVVWGDRVYTEFSNTSGETSALMLTMGTVLESVDTESANTLINNRAVYQNHAVWVPTRNDDGGYLKKQSLIPEHNEVSEGYLPLTEGNISKVALSALGNAYGWGGSLFSDDCSGYVRNIYKCFGLELARNTTWQTAMPMAKADMKYMCREERIKLMDSLPIGSILYFSGHEMLYLGKRNDKYYVISSISSVMQPENSSVRQRIRSIVINTTDVKRANKNTWLDDLTCALIPYRTAESGAMPEYEWYHDGVAFCIKNKLIQGDENKLFNPNNNVTGAEILQILYNKEGISDKSDKDGGKWYDKAVEWAEKEKLIHSEVGFAAEEPIEREALVSILYLYAKGKGVDTDKKIDFMRYDDVNDVSKYAVSAVEFALASGLVYGKTEHTINPKDYTTRAETAVILERFDKIITNNG